jgi:NAD(P)-dependent dehydrogenase (short-subunit alcohol dehydrogenase family)
MKHDFTDRVVIVAGGARGIGARTARDLVAAGAQVVIGDNNEALGAALAADLGTESATFVPLDVVDPASCAASVAEAVRRFGHVDYLVNCAIALEAGALLDLPIEKWSKTIDVGLTGTFLMSRTFAQWLIAAGRQGAIVNLSSIAGFHPYGDAGAYSTVKAAILHLSELMGLEWAPNGIRVNAVAPGTIETPLTAYLQDSDVRASRTAAVPLGRIG